ncbi:YfcE family phosphodiesterase [Halobiforma lacisalsi AJ5]|uniref:Phosphoesterase n=1 Tax=Natronobacterium lacisalsi AJ5 TaxID=358396 RepID=M0LU64_NATLA|nr:YfcE family phosphodiesterase [Halobiforma lacisalsi]APW97528.1 YfcE family phosphodiesterase [Halobiforma lacisalsi AJ5]EMA37092.1 phosphodiesterase, MJ0936 family protein [Halobiforma lacisalsi AJ5]
MRRVAICSDTHVPSRANEVPDWVAAELRRADHAIHAGDFDSRRAYDRIEELADGDLTCARGNMDPATLEAPAAATRVVEGVTFVVTHGTGSPDGWRDRIVETARSKTDPEVDPVVVAGHTHRVVDTTVDGIRVLNPGSATGAAPADRETMYVATVEGGDLEVELLTG